MITVKETSSEERQKEMVETFEKMRPFLERGFSYTGAYQLIMGKEHNSFSRRRWWRDLLEYGKQQGFDKKYQGCSTRGRTGLLYVCLSRSPNTSSGMLWRYYYSNEFGDLKTISNVDLTKLRKEVEERGLPWKVVDMELAKKSYDMNKELSAHHKSSTSGVFHVQYQKDKRSPNGYYWRYVGEDGSICYAQTLLELKQRVEKENRGEWKILDSKIYELWLEREGDYGN